MRRTDIIRIVFLTATYTLAIAGFIWASITSLTDPSNEFALGTLNFTGAFLVTQIAWIVFRALLGSRD